MVVKEMKVRLHGVPESILSDHGRVFLRIICTCWDYLVLFWKCPRLTVVRWIATQMSLNITEQHKSIFRNKPMSMIVW